jgi:hypothetical protein
MITVTLSCRAACVALCLALVACAGRSGSAGPLPLQEHAGHYVHGQGSNWFQPCSIGGAESRLWVTFMDLATLQLERARQSGLIRDGQRSFVRFRAELVTDGPPASAGAALLVRDVVEARAAGPHDCAGR